MFDKRHLLSAGNVKIILLSTTKTNMHDVLPLYQNKFWSRELDSFLIIQYMCV